MSRWTWGGSEVSNISCVGRLRACRVAGEHRSTASEQHPRERQQVIDGRDEPGCAVAEGRGPAPGAVWLVEHDQPVRRRSIAGCKPFGLRRPEARVAHPERLEDPGSEDVPEGLTGGAGEQHAQHRCTGVVQPTLAGLGQQRKRSKVGDPGRA